MSKTWVVKVEFSALFLNGRRLRPENLPSLPHRLKTLNIWLAENGRSRGGVLALRKPDKKRPRR